MKPILTSEFAVLVGEGFTPALFQETFKLFKLNFSMNVCLESLFENSIKFYAGQNSIDLNKCIVIYREYNAPFETDNKFEQFFTDRNILWILIHNTSLENLVVFCQKTINLKGFL